MLCSRICIGREVDTFRYGQTLPPPESGTREPKKVTAIEDEICERNYVVTHTGIPARCSG